MFSLRNKSLGDSILLQYIICFHRRSALSEEILKTFLASVDAFQRNDIEKWTDFVHFSEERKLLFSNKFVQFVQFYQNIHIIIQNSRTALLNSKPVISKVCNVPM